MVFSVLCPFEGIPTFLPISYHNVSHLRVIPSRRSYPPYHSLFGTVFSASQKSVLRIVKQSNVSDRESKGKTV